MDLLGLAWVALASKGAADVGPQVAFLEAAGRRLAGRPTVEPLSVSSPPLLSLLRDGVIQVHGGGTLAGLLAELPPRVTLETIAGKLEALAWADAEVWQAIAVVLDRQPPRA